MSGVAQEARLLFGVSFKAIQEKEDLSCRTFLSHQVYTIHSFWPVWPGEELPVRLSFCLESQDSQRWEGEGVFGTHGLEEMTRSAVL